MKSLKITFALFASLPMLFAGCTREALPETPEVPAAKTTGETRAGNFTFTSPSFLFTADELARMVPVLQNAPAGSTLAQTYAYLNTRCNSTYNPASVALATKQTTNASTLHDVVGGPAGLARNMALGHYLIPEKSAACGAKAVEILMSWAEACKDVQYTLETGTGMLIARGLYPFACTYDLMKNTGCMTDAQKAVVETWFANMAEQIKVSVMNWHTNDYFNKQHFQNHCVAHVLGLLMFGYAIEDPALVQYAYLSSQNPRDVNDLWMGTILMSGQKPHHREPANAPAPWDGEIYDRYRTHTAPKKGFQYAHLSMSLLTNIGIILTNNGIEMFDFVARTGENLGLAYDFYADFYRTFDNTLKNGFYVNEDMTRMGKAGDLIAQWEIGLKYYPDSQPIRELIYNPASKYLTQTGSDAKYNRGKSGCYSDLMGYYRLFSALEDPTH